MKLFNKFETKEVEVKDPGLKDYIKIEGKMVVKSHGRERDKFSKANVNIIERIVNMMCVPGHRRKKQKIETFWATGKYSKNMKKVLEALDIIQEKTEKNPLQVVVQAIENSAPRDGITTIEYGGARYPQAVDISPLKRINLALRNLIHASYDKSHNAKTKIEVALAEELIKASENNTESSAIKRKIEIEKQADSAR